MKLQTDLFSSDLSGLTLTTSASSSGLMVKDEYDFDGPQSLPSIEGGHCIQTIQHPPASHPNASEPFVPSNLLPPTEASTSATASSFAMAAGSGSKRDESESFCAAFTFQRDQRYFFTCQCLVLTTGLISGRMPYSTTGGFLAQILPQWYVTRLL